MAAPFRIFIEGQELVGYTRASLERKKKDLTGSLTVDVFFTHLPSAPVMSQAMRGKEITVYVGGNLAFTGKVDKRNGTGKKAKSGAGEAPESGGEVSYTIGKDEYTVSITARGKTKALIGSSHTHKTSQMLQPKTKQVAETLTEDFDITIVYDAEDLDLDKANFRDGAMVLDEIDRLCTENGFFRYETPDGKLKITESKNMPKGEDIILGDNILTFRAEQSEDEANSKITVKGQRTKKEIWGKDAVNRIKITEDKWVKTISPIVIQHYGDATDKALERRARFEANKRSSQSKEITVEVFHVQSRNGDPWDIGVKHYVEIPPEGIFDDFECVGVKYEVDAKSTLKTTLTLSPPPDAGQGGGGSSPRGQSRRAQLGVPLQPGSYPDPWTGPSLFDVPVIGDALAIATNATAAINQVKRLVKSPPLKLPEHLR